MKSHYAVLFLLVVTCFWGSCSPTENMDETYIPLVTNQWTDVALPEHQFSLTADQENVSAGRFRGEESISGIIISDTLFGSFSNRNITFTVRRSNRDTVYRGRYIADTLIDLGGLKIFRR